MRTSLLPLAAACWLVLALSACGSESDAAMYFSYDDSIVDMQCDCYAGELGFDTPAACKASAWATDTERGCFEGVIEANAGAVEAPLTCLVDVLDELEQCIGALPCGDDGAWNECADRADERWARCPQFPDAVDEALGTCLSLGVDT